MGKQIVLDRENKPPSENVYFCLKISLIIPHDLGLAYIVIVCQENNRTPISDVLSLTRYEHISD